MLGAVFDKQASKFSMQTLVDQLSEARKTLSSVPTIPAPDPPKSTLPLGIGLLPFVSDLDDAMTVVAEYRPAIVWLFAVHEFADFGVWATKVRAASPQSKIWVQVGTVSAAVEIARLCSPALDGLVLQGSDAGGHGFEHGASIVSLLPEATDVLHANGFGSLPLIAAGGIVDGRGVAAALALGAAGVVMGTRFLGARETDLHPSYREAVLKARDGALSTVRAKVFDELKWENMWPDLYDGRALATESYRDHRVGVDIKRIRERYYEAAAREDEGFGGRAAVWAGSGVGLVNEVMGATEIVKEVREEAKSVIDRLKA
jgi:nitronate monooxygenase